MRFLLGYIDCMHQIHAMLPHQGAGAGQAIKVAFGTPWSLRALRYLARTHTF